jgi:hypothetical protein
MCIEGCYGSTYPLRIYPDIVFVCEDHGFGLAYSYALELKNKIDGDYVVLFIWVVSDEVLLNMLDSELTLLSSDARFETRTYASPSTTNKELPQGSQLSNVDLRERPETLQPIHFNNNYEFPDFLSICQLRTRQTTGPLCFASACSPSVERVFRYSVADSLKQAHCRVDYYNLLC